MFVVLSSFLFFFFKQKTAYEMRISDWSSDVCSSDLIPNENLMTQEVENWSYSDRNVRVRIPVRVSYKSDLERAQALMMRAAVESPRTLDSPKPNVRLTAFGDSAVEHEILVWISDPEGGVGSVHSDVLIRLWHLFKQTEIGRAACGE